MCYFNTFFFKYHKAVVFSENIRQLAEMLTRRGNFYSPGQGTCPGQRNGAARLWLPARSSARPLGRPEGSRWDTGLHRVRRGDGRVHLCTGVKHLPPLLGHLVMGAGGSEDCEPCSRGSTLVLLVFLWDRVSPSFTMCYARTPFPSRPRGGPHVSHA